MYVLLRDGVDDGPLLPVRLLGVLGVSCRPASLFFAAGVAVLGGGGRGTQRTDKRAVRWRCARGGVCRRTGRLAGPHSDDTSPGIWLMAAWRRVAALRSWQMAAGTSPRYHKPRGVSAKPVTSFFAFRCAAVPP